jgi:PAS domain S-box-containing protein
MRRPRLARTACVADETGQENRGVAIQLVLAVSILLQLAAVLFAFRLNWITGKRAAWTLIAAAVLLMALRRCITFVAYLSGEVSTPPDMATELVAVGISALMLAGIVGIAPVFRSRMRFEQELREQREWFRVSLSSIGDAVIATDLDGRVHYTNPVAQGLCGWSGAEASGKPLEDVFRIINEETRETASNPVEKVLESGLVVGLANHTVLIARDGTERPIDDSAAPIRDDEGTIRGVVLVFRDVSERKRAERRLAAQHETARILAEAGTLEEAVPRILEAVCRNLGWDVGGLWTVDEEADVLRCVQVWHAPSVNAPQLEADCRERALARNEGLPGRVWETRRPLWLADAPNQANFPRATLAAREGLHGAFAVPIALRDEVLGVMEFFSREVRQPDDEMLSMMTTIGSQIGQFIERRRAESELRESEALKGSILTSALDCIITIDEGGRVMEWNPAAEKTFGYSRPEVVGRKMADLIVPPELRERHDRGMAHYLETGEGPVLGRRIEITGMRKDASIFPVELAITPIRLGTRQVFTAYVRDIAERRRAEEALQESEHRFRAVFNQQFQFMAVLSPEGVVLEINELPLRATGIRREQVLGRLFWETPFWDGLPEMRTAWPARLTDAASADGPVLSEDRYRTAEGNVRIADAAVTAAKAPDGRVEFFIIQATDITERKAAEEALRESEARFRFLAESMPQKIFTARPNGDVDYFNRQWTEFTGLSFEQIRDWGWTQFIHPEDVEENVRRWRHSIDTGEPFQLEHRFRRADGVFRWHLSRAHAMRDPTGTALMWIGSNTDIDDLKRAEGALQEADRRKDEFLAMLAHELRNPLASIGNAAALLRLADSDEHREWAREVVERQVKHLAHLVDDLLDVSRITRGMIGLKKERLDPATVLDAAVEAVRPLIEERKHGLTFSCPRGELWVDADPTRLAQILVNLLTNAAKYTESGGRIRLDARREGQEIVFSVRDTGIGIPPQHLPHIFELFAQGDRSLARSEGGLGIGLTLVKKLAEMHGGSVVATSPGPGKGAEFVVRLPAAEKPEEIGARERAGASARRTARILVVDDNVDVARGMVKLLRMLGHEVRTAYDGPSAIEVGRAFEPDFILLDIGLPGKDGYQVAAELREDACCKDVVFIAITGYGMEEDRRRSKQAGFDHHLVKPIDYDALVSLIT